MDGDRTGGTGTITNPGSDPDAPDSRTEDGNPRTAAAVAVLLVLVVGIAAVTVAATGIDAAAQDDETLHLHGELGPPIGEPTRWTGPQGQIGQFVARCAYSHSAPDDPIVHYQHPGRSHRHDFYGAEGANAFSTAEQLLVDETTCDKPADAASYWQPTLYDHGEVVEPIEARAYYRAAPGVDWESVVPFPFGMELITGDPTTDAAEDMTEAAGWVCGASTRLQTAPPNCSETTPLHMVLTFPDCWDGEHLRSDDFRSHAAYSADGECPEGHPVHIPQLTMAIKYPVTGVDHDLTLASGNVHSAHGDFLNAWDPEGLEREVRNCIHRNAVCDLVSNREEDGPFFSS